MFVQLSRSREKDRGLHKAHAQMHAKVAVTCTVSLKAHVVVLKYDCHAALGIIVIRPD